MTKFGLANCQCFCIKMVNTTLTHRLSHQHSDLPLMYNRKKKMVLHCAPHQIGLYAHRCGEDST